MQHLRYLRYLNFAMAALSGVLSLIVLGFWLLARSLPEELPFGFGLSWLGVLLLLMGLAVGHLIVGFLVGSSRGRVAQSALAVLQLSTFPVGTAFALYALWVCWANEPTRKAFDSILNPPIG